MAVSLWTASGAGIHGQRRPPCAPEGGSSAKGASRAGAASGAVGVLLLGVSAEGRIGLAHALPLPAREEGRGSERTALAQTRYLDAYPVGPAGLDGCSFGVVAGTLDGSLICFQVTARFPSTPSTSSAGTGQQQQHREECGSMAEGTVFTMGVVKQLSIPGALVSGFCASDASPHRLVRPATGDDGYFANEHATLITSDASSFCLFCDYKCPSSDSGTSGAVSSNRSEGDAEDAAAEGSMTWQLSGISPGPRSHRRAHIASLGPLPVPPSAGAAVHEDGLLSARHFDSAVVHPLLWTEFHPTACSKICFGYLQDLAAAGGAIWSGGVGEAVGGAVAAASFPPPLCPTPTPPPCIEERAAVPGRVVALSAHPASGCIAVTWSDKHLTVGKATVHSDSGGVGMRVTEGSRGVVDGGLGGKDVDDIDSEAGLVVGGCPAVRKGGVSVYDAHSLQCLWSQRIQCKPGNCVLSAELLSPPVHSTHSTDLRGISPSGTCSMALMEAQSASAGVPRADLGSVQVCVLQCAYEREAASAARRHMPRLDEFLPCSLGATVLAVSSAAVEVAAAGTQSGRETLSAAPSDDRARAADAQPGQLCKPRLLGHYRVDCTPAAWQNAPPASLAGAIARSGIGSRTGTGVGAGTEAVHEEVSAIAAEIESVDDDFPAGDMAAAANTTAAEAGNDPRLAQRATGATAGAAAAVAAYEVAGLLCIRRLGSQQLAVCSPRGVLNVLGWRCTTNQHVQRPRPRLQPEGVEVSQEGAVIKFGDLGCCRVGRKVFS